MTGSHLNSRLIPERAEQPNVLHALIRKRSEIAGRIEHLQEEMRAAVIDLDNIDASIHIFDPELELEAIKPKPVPPRHQAFRGEVSRIVFTTLRNAKIKLRTADVATRVMAERGLDTSNVRLRKLISNRVGSCMRLGEKKGLIRGEFGPDRLKYWEIVRRETSAPPQTSVLMPSQFPVPVLRQIRRLPKPR
jgi:hypothetical protein